MKKLSKGSIIFQVFNTSAFGQISRILASYKVALTLTHSLIMLYKYKIYRLSLSKDGWLIGDERLLKYF